MTNKKMIMMNVKMKSEMIMTNMRREIIMTNMQMIMISVKTSAAAVELLGQQSSWAHDIDTLTLACTHTK